MEYYPGNIINYSSVDYKKKIQGKGEELNKPGEIYIQKCQNLKFIAFAFMKIMEDKV